MFTRDLWNPDEPRYTEVAREMVVLDDYLVPHLNGQSLPREAAAVLLDDGRLLEARRRLRSPPGWSPCWPSSASWCSSTSPRRRYLAGTGALLAAAVALSTFLLSYLARRGVIDPLLVFFTTAAALAGYQAMQPDTRRRRLYWLGCYAAMGLGTLEKGPVAFLVPGLVLLVYGMLERRRVKGGGWVHLAGVALFLAIALPWVVPACRVGGKDYTDMILVVKQLSARRSSRTATGSRSTTTSTTARPRSGRGYWCCRWAPWRPSGSGAAGRRRWRSSPRCG